MIILAQLMKVTISIKTISFCRHMMLYQLQASSGKQTRVLYLCYKHSAKDLRGSRGAQGQQTLHTWWLPEAATRVICRWHKVQGY